MNLQCVQIFENDGITQRLFDGEFLVVDSRRRFLDNGEILGTWQQNLADKIEDSFYPHKPYQAHRFFNYDEFYQRVNDLSVHIENNYQQEIISLLRSLDLISKTIYWDKLALRVVPPKNYFQNIAWHEHTTAHRDTWGVNLSSQINFWSSLYPVEANRTLQFYPQYWDQSITNTTGSWSYIKYKQIKARTQNDQKVPYPTMPQSLITPQNGQPVVLDPFVWLLFSAAHLHDSVPNHSPYTRFSLEFRIIDKSAIEKNVGAINVDNVATKRMPGIFTNLYTNERLKL